jgi:hypothetical protein
MCGDIPPLPQYAFLPQLFSRLLLSLNFVLHVAMVTAVLFLQVAVKQCLVLTIFDSYSGTSFHKVCRGRYGTVHLGDFPRTFTFVGRGRHASKLLWKHQISSLPKRLCGLGRVCLGPLEHWDRGFQSRSRYVCVLLCE